jgi:hypothetical protein
MHPPHAALRLVAVCVVGLTVAWLLDRGHRWAWYVTWAGLVSAASAVLMVAAVVGNHGAVSEGSPANFAANLIGHPVEATAGALQVSCGVGSFVYPLSREARDRVFRRGASSSRRSATS